MSNKYLCYRNTRLKTGWSAGGGGGRSRGASGVVIRGLLVSGGIDFLPFVISLVRLWCEGAATELALGYSRIWAGR